MLTLITPTRNRPECFAQLEETMSHQTLKWDEWLVINDGKPYTYNCNQTVLHRDASKDVYHSLCENLLAAQPKGNKILIIEDDDYYHPDYIKVMSEALEEADLVGVRPAYYYNTKLKRYWCLDNWYHCSLAATGFNENVLPMFKRSCTWRSVFVDTILWSHWRVEGGSYKFLDNDFAKPLYVGLKGRNDGLGMGHNEELGWSDENNIYERWTCK